MSKTASPPTWEGGMSASSLATPTTAERALLTGRQRRLAGTALTFLALGAVSVVMMLPLYLMILISFRTADRAFIYPPDLWFNSVTFENYPRALFGLLPFGLYVR